MKTEIKVRLGLGEIKGYNCITDIEMKDFESNQCTEILVDFFLEYIPVENVMQALSVWVTKLRKNAKIILNCTDLSQVGRAIVNRSLKVPEINKMLFGNGGNNSSCLTLDDVSSILEHLGLKIITKRIGNLNFTVIAGRL